MTDHADTIRRVLRGEDTPAIDRINALAEIASNAVKENARLLAERQQAQETIRMHDAQAATFLARAEQAEAERQQLDHDLHVASGILAENERTIADLRAERQQEIDALRTAPTPPTTGGSHTFDGVYEDWWLHSRNPALKRGEKP